MRSPIALRVFDVVEKIRAISEQSNLLALNATIEAVRSVDRGGSHLPAISEVARLASQTSTATSEVAVIVAELRSTTRLAEENIAAIVATIESIRETALGIVRPVQTNGVLPVNLTTPAFAAAVPEGAARSDAAATPLRLLKLSDRLALQSAAIGIDAADALRTG